MSDQELIPYIKISRSLFNHFLWREKRPFSRFEAWLDLIQKASFSEETTEIIKNKVIERNKGQVVGSIRFFMERWSWSKSKVCDFLELLRSHNMVSIDKANGISVITLINYKKHSGNRTALNGITLPMNGYESAVYNGEGDSEGTTEGTVRGQQGDSEGTNIIKVNKGELRKKTLSASFEAERKRQGEVRKKYFEMVEKLDNNDKKAIWDNLTGFIKDERPSFIEPYIDLWNLFGLTYKLIIKPIQLTRDRAKKFATRIKEPGFDFVDILQQIKKDEFLLGRTGGNWKVSFDHIIDSERNYVKILEKENS